MCFRNLLLLSLALLFWLPAIARAEEGNCAHAAAFNFLILSGRTIEKNQVMTAFAESHRGEKPVPVRELVRALNHLNANARAVQFNPQAPSSDWSGAILLLFDVIDGNGHYVTCKEIKNDRAVLLDPDYHLEERVISLQQLQAIWSGTAIQAPKRNTLRVLESALFSVLLAFICIISLRFWRFGLRANATCLTLILAFAIGCKLSQDGLPQRISFSEDLIRLEHLTEGRILTIQLNLKNDSDKEAKIRKVATSCSCMKVKGELAGKVVQSGANFPFIVQIDPSDKEVVGAVL